MAALLYINVKFTPGFQPNERHRISGINLRGLVENLKEKICKEINMSVGDTELICFGKRLKPEKTIESYGIKNGTTIHVIKKQYNDLEPVPSVKTLSQVEIHQLVVALRSALVNPAFRTMLNNLSKPESMESIIAATPGLAEDPVAIAILQDFDLLMLVSDPTHIHRVVEMHPSLAEAVTHIAAAFHEDVSSQNSTLPMAPSLVSYSLDALSDDDDMDSDSQGLPFPPSTSNNAMSPIITPADLASAIAAATASTSGPVDPFGASSSQPPPSPQLQAPPPTPHPVITSEMFTQAMQHALGSVNHNNQAQLQQLRDMGISDDAMSLRALQATDGDVQAALEFIFGELASQDDNHQNT